MVGVVIPARNEGRHIKKVLSAVRELPVDLVIPVVNGSTDDTLDRLQEPFPLPMKICRFKTSVGIDVPRAIGAAVALQEGASVVLFLDGDMEGIGAANLRELIKTVQEGADIALTDCYATYSPRGALAEMVLFFREKLNRELGLFNKIGVATPSHGPHALSRSFLSKIPLATLAVPPGLLALAAKGNFRVAIGTSIPHDCLGSTVRKSPHNEKIAKTIIGDCIEALCVYRDEKKHRLYRRHKYLGYNSERRFDILEDFLRGNYPVKKYF